MSLVVSYRLVAPLLEATLAATPAMRLRIEQEVALRAGSTVLTFRATSESEAFGAFEAALENDRTVSEVRLLDESIDGERRYRITVPANETTYWEWAALGCVLLDATVTQDGWNVRMRFPDRAALTAYRACCDDRGLAFTLRSVREATEQTSTYPYGLTAPQYEILAAALAGGYFEVPRGIRMSELASEFDISDQAASERLRRALSRVLGTLAVDEYYR
ncbi:helix-turn-helix domain-containing protein [Halobacteriales archaeon QS_3_64_16]|nr:MAG: helix-turn-helix domain-containing protein [Halobacteriales archaeon QS_3_64_16]